MDNLLNRITQIAGLNDEEKQKVINNFYKNIALLVLDSLSSVDSDSANKLSGLIEDFVPDSNDEIKSLLEDISKNPKTAKVVNEGVNSFVSDFATKIVDSSNEEQRSQIKEVVSQYQASL